MAMKNGCGMVDSSMNAQCVDKQVILCLKSWIKEKRSATTVSKAWCYQDHCNHFGRTEDIKPVELLAISVPSTGSIAGIGRTCTIPAASPAPLHFASI